MHEPALLSHFQQYIDLKSHVSEPGDKEFLFWQELYHFIIPHYRDCAELSQADLAIVMQKHLSACLGNSIV